MSVQYTTDTIKNGLISKKLRPVAVDRKKLTADVWEHLTQVCKAPADGNAGVGDMITGWAACKYCYQGFTSHKAGKNYGISHMERHFPCTTMPVTASNSTDEPRVKQSRVTSFAVVKKQLSKPLAEQLKVAELKFVVKGLHSFLSVENEGLTDLAQTCISIGNTSGNVAVKDIWYGRRTVRDTAIEEFKKIGDIIGAEIAEPTKNGYVACTTDMWTDDHVKRSYLDFTIFWIDDEFRLKHTMARCKVFPPERHTGQNIRRELEGIMKDFDLAEGDTPTTTDAGSNFIAALREEARYQCMAHRINTVLEDAWNNTIASDDDFHEFTENVRKLIAYVRPNTLIANRLPKKLQSESGTRKWRSYHYIHQALFQSYDALEAMLGVNMELDRMAGISKELTGKIADFFAKFNPMFDKLEAASEPSLQYVIPAYYVIVDSICKPCSTDPGCLALLKTEISLVMGEKYWSSTTPLHKTATLLDPSFKDLKFLSTNLEKQRFQADVKKSLIQFNTVPAAEVPQVPTKRARHATDSDPFAVFRSGDEESADTPGNSTISGELAAYLGNSSKTSKNPLGFWRDNAMRFPLMSKIARKVLVVQATSGESERHFSEAGNIVTGSRSNLHPDSVESLVVLKEASLNKLW